MQVVTRRVGTGRKSKQNSRHIFRVPGWLVTDENNSLEAQAVSIAGGRSDFQICFSEICHSRPTDDDRPTQPKQPRRQRQQACASATPLFIEPRVLKCLPGRDPAPRIEAGHPANEDLELRVHRLPPSPWLSLVFGAERHEKPSKSVDKGSSSPPWYSMKPWKSSMSLRK